MDKLLHLARPSRWTIVLRGVTNHLCSAVCHVDNGAVRCTHHGLSLTVAVPVVGYDVGLVVLEICQVRTALYPPQALAVQLIDLDDAILTLIAPTCQARIDIALVPHLNQYFQLAVTVNIGHAGIVRLVDALQVTMVWSYFQIGLAPGGHLGRCRLLAAAHYGSHLITATCRAASIDIIRGRQAGSNL